MKQIIFVTGNQLKVLYANTVLNQFGFEVIGKKLEIIEPREEEPEKVVIEKAMQAFKKIKQPLIVEDSGIFIKALNGFPKTFVHFALDTIGIQNILKMMEGVEDRSVEFRQSLAYFESGMTEPIVISYVDGGFSMADKIWANPDYDSGDFDKVLIPPGQTQPLCMFSQEWRANRDATQNKGRIHYEQLGRFLIS